MAEYRIDPDFVRPEPTPADFFSFRDDPGPEGRHALFVEMAEGWKGEAKQGRFTVTEAGDSTGYPPGLWFEGWKDPLAVQLPFGEAVNGEGPIYPPLTHQARVELDGQPAQ